MCAAFLLVVSYVANQLQGPDFANALRTLYEESKETELIIYEEQTSNIEYLRESLGKMGFDVEYDKATKSLRVSKTVSKD